MHFGENKSQVLKLVHGRVNKSWILCYLKSMKTGKGFIDSIGFVTPGDHHFIYMFIQICEWRNGSFICFKYCKASSRLSTAGLEQFIDTSRWKNLLTFQKQNIESINTILYGIISKSFIDWLNDLSLFCARRR